jgi:AcrR family transcriptional regulator
VGRGPETRERIVTAARTLFAERGFDGATIAEIARRAEITEGAIYRHFKDKQELFMECVGPVVEEAFTRTLARVQEATDVQGMVRSIVEGRLQLLEENQESFDILFTEAPYHPELKALLYERVRAQAEQVGPALERVLKDGFLKRRPNLLIIGLGLTVGMWSVLKFRDEHGGLTDCLGMPMATRERLLDDLVDFVLYGMAGERTGGQA